MRLGFFAYPWDLADEGPEEALEVMASRCHSNAILVNSNYHHARLLRPRARGPKTLQLPGAVAAFEPDAVRYAAAGITPVAEPGLVNSRVLTRTREICAAAGIDFGLWSVGLHNSTLGVQHPDLCVRNCFGDIYTYSLCPAGSRVRAYMTALVDDLAAQFRPDRIVMEAIGYLGMRHWVHHELFFVPWNESLELLLSLCFCPACVESARGAGIDLELLRLRVSSYAELLLDTERGDFPATETEGQLPSLLVEIEELQPALRWRAEIVTTMVADLHAIAHSAGVALEVIPASFHRLVSRAWFEGASLSGLGGASDGLLIPSYFDSAAEVEADLAWAASDAPGHLLSAGLNACAPSLSGGSSLEAQALACHAAGCSAIYHYNYGLLTERRLAWVAQANAAVLEREERAA